MNQVFGQDMTNYLGTGSIDMKMDWTAGFDVYLRSFFSCSELLGNARNISAGDTTFRLSALVTLRYVYVPLEISSFVNSEDNKARITWTGTDLTGITCVIESKRFLTEELWVPVRTNVPSGPTGSVTDLDLGSQGQGFYRIRVPHYPGN